MLVLQYLALHDVVIACKSLKRLAMTWRVLKEAPLGFPTIHCFNLNFFEVDGFPWILPNIPSLLWVLPILETLKNSCFCENSREVVLQHERVCDVVIKKCSREVADEQLLEYRNINVAEFELTLIMPALLRVDVKDSGVRALKVAPRERSGVKFVY